eukprot:TRINITY_DN2796_c2_g2_i2.p1 TRINITY_DN2796_c2_g2~~TRINITY_DN2796_c2_g2_i2.p1  ORF type:complete len:258 (+),score=41.68 TRINITY_DN2796_c2_g2_i2:70-843(+)
MEKNIGKDMSPNQGIMQPYQNNGQKPNYGTAPPYQQNPMQPGHGNAQPYQVGVPLAVIADGGGPVPQVSEQQLAQMAKNKWFHFENGTWILKPPRNLICSIIMLIIALLAFVGIPVGAYFVFDSYYPLAGLAIPLILICLFAYTGGSTTMIFDDREGTVYYKTTRMSCGSKESIIKYSDCVSINAVLQTRTSTSTNQTTGSRSTSTTTYYSYSLVTLDGNYEMLCTYDNLDEVSLNAFLRERLASTGMPEGPVPVEI